MRVERPEAVSLAGFETGDHVSVTWEGHDGRMHVLNGRIVGRTARSLDVQGARSTTAFCIGASVIRTISKLAA